MFKNPVVLWGYPMARRPDVDQGIGLEIPLDMLTALTDATGLSCERMTRWSDRGNRMRISERNADSIIRGLSQVEVRAGATGEAEVSDIL